LSSGFSANLIGIEWLHDRQTGPFVLDISAKQVAFPSQMVLLRCIFGNPFRPVTLDPAWFAWNDGAVRKMAQAAYDQRAMPSGHLDAARLAVSADALEDAGCGQAEILAHLRCPGPHVRGCWVIDLLLGKN
jgi:hypothetical protein